MNKNTLTCWVQFFDDSRLINTSSLPSGWECEEVAFGPTIRGSYGVYWGLFWKKKSKRPDRKQIEQMLREAEFDFNDENADFYKEKE